MRTSQPSVAVIHPSLILSLTQSNKAWYHWHDALKRRPATVCIYLDRSWCEPLVCETA